MSETKNISGKAQKFVDSVALLDEMRSNVKVSKLDDQSSVKKIRNWKQYCAICLVILSIMTIVGGSFTFATFRKLQNRLELLEHRLEDLEKREAWDAHHLRHVNPSLETGRQKVFGNRVFDQQDPIGRKRRRRRNINGGRKKRSSTTTTLTPTEDRQQCPMRAIQLEMHNSRNHQRRRRNPSAENSSLIANWKVSPWVTDKEKEEFSVQDIDNSAIIVQQKGIYFVYSQILFHNLAARSIFSIKIDGKELARCYRSVDYVDNNHTGTNDDQKKYKSCYTGAVTMIEANQSVTVHNLYQNEIDEDANSNFFGIIRLTDSL